MSKNEKVYLIEGHGYENPIDFDKRFRLPEDTYLVLFTEFSVPLLLLDMCKYLDFLRNKKNYNKVSNPVEYKDELKKYMPSIRVYKPGDYIPDINTTLLLDHERDFKKSGIFKIPNVPLINRKAFPIFNKLDTEDRAKIKKEVKESYNYEKSLRCYKYEIQTNQEKLTEPEYNEIYHGSLVKPGYENYNKMRYNLAGLITILGKGVYYFGGCRSLHEDNEEFYQDLHILLVKANIQLITNFRDIYNGLLRKKLKKTEADFYRKYKDDYTKYKTMEKRSDYKDLLENIIYDKINKVQLFNSRYHDSFMSLARFFISFDSLSDDLKDDIKYHISNIKRIHPHRSLIDKSEEQQFNVSSRKTAKIRQRSPQTTSTNNRVEKYMALNPS